MFQARHLSQWKPSMGKCPQYSVERVGVRTDKVRLGGLRLRKAAWRWRKALSLWEYTIMSVRGVVTEWTKG